MVKEYIKKNDFAEKQYVRGLNLVYDIIFNKRKNVILQCVMKCFTVYKKVKIGDDVKYIV